jgi:hypothetical protein
MSLSRFSIIDFVNALNDKVKSELAKVHLAKGVEVHDFDNEVERIKLEEMMKLMLQLTNTGSNTTPPAELELTLKENIRFLLATNVIQVYINEKERSWGSTKLGQTFAVYQSIIENAVLLPVGEHRAHRDDNFLLPPNYKHTNDSDFLKAFLGLIDSTVLVEAVMKEAMLHLAAADSAQKKYLENKKDVQSEKLYKEELEKYVSSIKVIVRLHKGSDYYNDLVEKYFQNVFLNLDDKCKKESAIRSKAKKLIENANNSDEATLADLHRVVSMFNQASPKENNSGVTPGVTASSQPPALPLPVAMHTVVDADLVKGSTGTPPSANKKLTAARQTDSPTHTPTSQTMRLGTSGTPPLTPDQVGRRLQVAVAREPIVHPSPPMTPTRAPTTMPPLLEVETKESKDVSLAAILTSSNTQISPTPTDSPTIDNFIPLAPTPPAAPELAVAVSNRVPTPQPVAPIVSSDAPPPPPMAPVISSVAPTPPPMDPVISSVAPTAPPMAPVISSVAPTAPLMAPVISSVVPTPPPMAPAISSDAPPPPPMATDAPPAPSMTSSTAKMARVVVAAKPAPAGKSVLSQADFASQLAARAERLKKTTTVDKSAPVIEKDQTGAPVVSATTNKPPGAKLSMAEELARKLQKNAANSPDKGNRASNSKDETRVIKDGSGSTTSVRPASNPASPVKGASGSSSSNLVSVVTTDGSSSPTSVASAALASKGGMFATNNAGSPVTSPVTSPSSATSLPSAATPYRTTSTGAKSKYGKDGSLLGSPTAGTQIDGAAELRAQMDRRKQKEVQAAEEALKAKAETSAPSHRLGG